MIYGESGISIDELIETRLKLVNIIRKELTTDEKKFIVSLKKSTPEWDLLGIDKAKDLPAVQWKIINLKRMSGSKRKGAA